ncbi:hypothetical protein SS50377_20559 [Spironucleus salmonicida]|nr:hypothetical protein SS50377_20559 [Spironucleus salmonicida]
MMTAALPAAKTAKTTLLKSYQQVSSPEVISYLKLKLFSLDIRATDEQSFAQSFRAVNPYSSGFLQDYASMTKTPQKSPSYDAFKLLEFHAKFGVLDLMKNLYTTYFSQLKQNGLQQTDSLFTIAAVGKVRYSSVISQFVHGQFATLYKEFSHFQLAPPGKLINIFNTELERIHQNAQDFQQIDVPYFDYLQDIELFPQFVNNIQKHSFDIGVKLLVLDNLDTQNDYFLSVQQSMNNFYQLILQIAVAIYPQVVISGGSVLIKIRELTSPAMASILQILAYFYEEICYFHPDFSRVLTQEKWVYCTGKKRVERQIAKQVAEQLIQFSQQVKEFEVGVDLDEEFEYLEHLLPVNQKLVEYIRGVNIKSFKNQRNILQHGLIYYSRIYKPDIFDQLLELQEFVFTANTEEITAAQFLELYSGNNPEIGLIFPSNEKREKMVYRYLERINPDIKMIQDFKYVLELEERSLSVRWNNKEIEQKTIKMVVVVTEKERLMKEKIEREKKDKEDKERKEREKLEVKEVRQEQIQVQKQVVAQIAKKAVPQKQVSQVMQKPKIQASETGKSEELNQILKDVLLNQNVVSKPQQVEKVKVSSEPPQKTLKGAMKGKSLLFAGKGKGMGMIEKKEEPKAQPKRNLLKNVRKQM